MYKRQADRSVNNHIKLDYLQVTSGVGVRSVASLGLNIAGEHFEAAASGNGCLLYTSAIDTGSLEYS